MIDAFEREFPDDNAFFKPEIMHIQPITPFKAIQESKVITKLKDAWEVSQNENLNKNSTKYVE